MISFKTARSMYKLEKRLDGWYLARVVDGHPNGHIDRFTREGLGKFHKLLEPPKIFIGLRPEIRLPDGKFLHAGEIHEIDGAVPVECIPEFDPALYN